MAEIIQFAMIDGDEEEKEEKIEHYETDIS